MLQPFHVGVGEKLIDGDFLTVVGMKIFI